MRVFHRVIAPLRSVRLADVARLVAESPSSRFWVSEERAAIVISAMAAGRPLPPMTPTRREMFAELYRRYLLLRPLHPGWSVLRIMEVVVHQPAPKFYFTPRTMQEFIYRILNGYYDRKEAGRRDPR